MPAQPRTQHRIQIDAPGGPEVLTLVTADVAEPGPGQVLVKVAAAGVNFIETYQRSGVYAVEHPFHPGGEFAGVVEELGASVTDFAVGDVVATSDATGTYAEYVTVDAKVLAKVPEGVDPVTAAAVPLQGFTAHYLTHDSYAVQPGDVVLTTAGAGGVGMILTQLLKSLGATVITTVSGGPDGDKARRAAAAGADHVLDYAQVPDKVREITHGRGVDAVYDGVGKDTFESSIASLRRRGTMVLFGGASGQVPPFDLQRLNALGSLSVTRPSLKDFMVTPEERAQRAADVFGAVAAGSLTITIGASFPLADAAAAHRALESRNTVGKVVLVP
ncbi:quinone oxidoreductase [Galactobacter sp.]|uniref:quinone oxidoreductase family protein n=1 Tax=Galactobacter sp. TaxID=2676125 RepID=UPI0025C6C56D|nr:quinone oxidoreductase [Galactobacter sp.]